MTSSIILKKSSVVGKVPVSGDLAYGELALNYADGKLYYKAVDNSIASISGGASGGSSQAFTYQSFTPTANQTTFTVTGGYTVGYLEAYLNGILLVNGTDYTATDGSTVVLSIGAHTIDTLTLRKWAPFNAVLIGGTSTGVLYYDASGTLTSSSALVFSGNRLTVANGITVSAGGASITGNVGVVGTLTAGNTSVGGRALDPWNTSRNVVSVGGATVAGVNYASTIGENSYNWYVDAGGTVRTQNTGVSGYFTFNNHVTGGFAWGLASSVAGGSTPSIAQVMGLDPNGNLGLGVTPSAWSGSKALEITDAGSSIWSQGAGDMRLSSGMYFNGTNAIYSATGNAVSQYRAYLGQHIWYTAPSGTAGNAITFTQAMTLDVNGNLGVGGAGSNNYRLEVAGNSQAKNTIGQTYQGVAASAMWVNSTGDWSLGLDSAAGATTRLKVGYSGNLMVGTTTNYTSGSGNAQLILPSALIAPTTGVDVTAFATGCYQDTYGGAWKHRGSWVASKYEQGSQHRWYVDRGTYGAGTPVSFDQAMTLDNAGNLLLGALSAASTEGYRFYKNYGRYDNGTFVGFIGAGSSLGTGTVTDFAIRSEYALSFLAGGGYERGRFDSNGNLQVLNYGNLSVGGRMLTVAQDKGFTVEPGGTYALNLEALSGLGTAGLLIIRGNENGINQTVAVYTYNLAYYVSTGTRNARLTQISRNTLNNGYGDVYPYFSNYSGSYLSADQSISGTSTSTSDVYFKNAVSYYGTANFSIIRIN